MTGWPPGSMPPSLSGHDSGVGGRQAPDALGARQPPRVFLVTFVSGTSRQDHQNMVLFAVRFLMGNKERVGPTYVLYGRASRSDIFPCNHPGPDGCFSSQRARAPRTEVLLSRA